MRSHATVFLHWVVCTRVGTDVSYSSQTELPLRATTDALPLKAQSSCERTCVCMLNLIVIIVFHLQVPKLPHRPKSIGI